MGSNDFPPRRGGDPRCGRAMDVREQVDPAGLRVLRQSGAWLFHQCPNAEDHARGDRGLSA